MERKGRLRFDVFGREIAVERMGGGWRPLLIGGEGKSRPADFEIPSTVAENELLGYLDDLFHEYATAARPSVRKL